MKPIKTDDLKEFIEHKKQEWTVFASGPTKDGDNKLISFNLEENKVKVEVYLVGLSKQGLSLPSITFTSVTAAVEYFNDEEW